MERQRSSNGAQNPLETYLREIDEIPLLSQNEEHELAASIEKGDREAFDRMVRANLRLVVNVARRYIGNGLDLQDLIEEGNLGLLRAVEGFDLAHETRFSTYATFWIKQAIKRALCNQARTVRIPAYMIDLLSKWHRAKDALKNKLGREPGFDEIAKSMDLPKKKQLAIRRALATNVSGQQDTDTEGQPSLEERMEDRGIPQPSSAMEYDEDRALMLQCIGKLGKRHRNMLELRYGLEGEPKTLEEIGKIYGITKERARQVINDAIAEAGELMGIDHEA